jgi:hypothetical protein
MTTILQEEGYCENICSEHLGQKLKIHKYTETQIYAICPLCNPIFNPDERDEYDCFCSSCGDFIYAVKEPTRCFMCDCFACSNCEYADDYFQEALCQFCNKKINAPSFRDEYAKKQKKFQMKK